MHGRVGPAVNHNSAESQVGNFVQGIARSLSKRALFWGYLEGCERRSWSLESCTLIATVLFWVRRPLYTYA